MARKFNRSEKLVIASHNQGKVREIRALLEPLHIEVIGASELDLEEPEETGQTFIENAELKASLAAKTANLPALSDDSGFAVLALGGAPGIYSARWAGPDKDFSHAMERVSTALLASGSTNRSCEFICALTLAWPDGHCESFEGRISGEVSWPPRGDRGFGYDAIFTPLGHSQTFGEMDPAEKHAMSHRAIAFNQLLEACFTP
ncbi:MAG: RdgB/HAM1 family non-canonical purine NTP pyrophosphatase [Alphaproteobacteria bacterium]|nr:RdgB/HAM1 family non-canonical purine NTP pyrophosphatase [Alphaproteobacteria bacterium]MBL6776321.1 RdgB/HAM1 family non-canonical purine NTP pyrophosphatase [Alphaproteobacteria bacterium]